MAKEFAKEFYSSKRWQDCRNEYARRRRYLCEDCLARGIIQAGEIVHHVEPLTPDNITDPKVALNFDNLRLVCRKCHAEEHGAKIARYTIDERGRVFIR